MADVMGDYKTLAREAAALPARLLFPPSCPGCRRHVTRPGTLCGRCWAGLRFIERPWCEVLGTPFSHDMGAGALSADAIANPPPFDRARAAVAHGGIARRLVHGLKYADRTDLAPWMADWMMRAGVELLAGAQLVAPVPLHRWRFLGRRYNQSAELARWVARKAALPFEAGLVERARQTRQQVGLGQREREDNVRGAFRVPETERILVAGRAVLLVDDVFTTGATVSAVARTLKRAGAARVDVLTFSRVLPGDFRPDEAEPI